MYPKGHQNHSKSKICNSDNQPIKNCHLFFLLRPQDCYTSYLNDTRLEVTALNHAYILGLPWLTITIYHFFTKKPISAPSIAAMQQSWTTTLNAGVLDGAWRPSIPSSDSSSPLSKDGSCPVIPEENSGKPIAKRRSGMSIYGQDIGLLSINERKFSLGNPNIMPCHLNVLLPAFIECNTKTY